MPEKSFLGGVKDHVSECFAEVYDELAQITTDEDRLADALKKVQKKLWADVIEPQLKQSYLNGKKAGSGNGRTVDRKPNPFRKD